MTTDGPSISPGDLSDEQSPTDKAASAGDWTPMDLPNLVLWVDRGAVRHDQVSSPQPPVDTTLEPCSTT